MNRLANWLCGQVWVYRWAATRGNRSSVRLHRLCIAKAAGISIGWRHVLGWLDVNDAVAAHEAQSGDFRHE